jgi:hypothetical protein
VAEACTARRHLGERNAVAQDELTKEQLTTLLREAEKAHAEYEKSLGRRDDDWPAWYAGFIVEKLHGGKKKPRSSGSW